MLKTISSPLDKLSISHIFLNIKFDKKRKVCQRAQGGSMGELIWWDSFQVSLISCNLRSPNQIVLTPGSPLTRSDLGVSSVERWAHGRSLREAEGSPFLPKNPPREAIILTASLKEGCFSGGGLFLWIVAHKDCHSCSSKKLSQLSSPCKRAW